MYYVLLRSTMAQSIEAVDVTGLYIRQVLHKFILSVLQEAAWRRLLWLRWVLPADECLMDPSLLLPQA